MSPTAAGLNLLGYVVFPHRRRLRADNAHRFRRRLRGLARAYGEGRAGWGDVDPVVQSWIGHARHADTVGLREAVFRNSVFGRGTGLEARSA